MQTTQLLTDPQLMQLVPLGLHVKFVVDVGMDELLLKPVSCAASALHGTAVGFIVSQCGAWNQANARNSMIVMTDGAQKIGITGAAPDCVVKPRKTSSRNSRARFVVEFECKHRNIAELKQRCSQYFQDDTPADGSGLYTRAVLAIHATFVRCQALLWERDPATNNITVTASWDYGRCPAMQDQLAARETVTDPDLPGPGATGLTRYDPRSQWPAAHANWTNPPGRPPLVNVGPGSLLHEVNMPDGALPASPLTIDLVELMEHVDAAE